VRINQKAARTFAKEYVQDGRRTRPNNSGGGRSLDVYVWSK